MGESDSAVELGEAAELFFEARHANQDQGDLVSVISVSEEFDGGGAEPLGFVDDDQFHDGEVASFSWLAHRCQVLLDADTDSGEHLVAFLFERPWGQQHAGRVENGPRFCQRGIYLRV